MALEIAQAGAAAAPTGKVVVPSGLRRPPPGVLALLRSSPKRSAVLLVAMAIVAVVIANTVTQVWLNRWNGDFYQAIEQRHLTIFLHQLVVFLVIAGILLVLVVGQTWLHEMLKIRLRQFLTLDLFEGWLAPSHAYQLSLAGDIGINPDQRVQEDARHLAELSADLGVGLVQSSLLLFTFVGVLWTLSSEVAFTIAGYHLVIPGFMLWGALGYALAGSLATWFVGRPLIHLNAERYAREAAFRTAAVRIGEYGEEIALHRGEADERNLLDAIFVDVVDVSKLLANALARVTWITSGYGWLAIVAPIVVAAPAYFAGNLDFGGLMMVVHAFFQVQQSLRWYVDNFPRIADWRATHDRVTMFRDALSALDDPADPRERVERTPGPDDRLAFIDLEVRLPKGWLTLDRPRIDIEPGSRVLIVGEPGIGKTRLFHAIAGLWPWGRGTILLPDEESIAFLPQRPYLPVGTLCGVVTYPRRPEACDDETVRGALVRVGLPRLTDWLERSERWDRELTMDEQQRLAFARLLLQAPRWVFLDEATSALPAEAHHRMLSVFQEELRETTVVALEREPAANTFYERIVRLHRIEPKEPYTAAQSGDRA